MSRSVCLSSIATRSIEPIVPPACPIAVATRPSIPGRWSIRTRRTNENCADVGRGTGGADVRRHRRQLPESLLTRGRKCSVPIVPVLANTFEVRPDARDRARYLAALRRADGGDPGPLGEFL